jgi:ligand-binding SRPBCC domain-containing protein
MDHIFETRLELPQSRDQVFAFFADAENLERITPPELRFRILTPRPITIAANTKIDYELRLFGMPFQWTTLISEWQPPVRFVDVQLRGPYALWVHTHSFEETAQGTAIHDHVRYRLPLSPLGDLAYPFVRRQLARIFAHRERVVLDTLTGRDTAGDREPMRGTASGPRA